MKKFLATVAFFAALNAFPAMAGGIAAPAEVPQPAANVPVLEAPDSYPISVVTPYAFATAPTQSAGAVFLTLQNLGAADQKLVGASSPVAETVELHTMAMENNVMQMRKIDIFDLPAGGSLLMTPHGHHVMLIGLKAPLAAGDKFPLQLDFAGLPSLEIEVSVVPPGADAPAAGSHGAHGKMHEHMQHMPAPMEPHGGHSHH